MSETSIALTIATAVLAALALWLPLVRLLVGIGPMSETSIALTVTVAYIAGLALWFPLLDLVWKLLRRGRD